MTLEYPTPRKSESETTPPENTEPGSQDKLPTILGVEVRELTTPVAVRLSRYRIATILRNTDVEESFENFTPDGPCRDDNPSEGLVREARNWGSGIWSLPRRKSKMRGKKQVLTLRIGTVASDDQRKPTRRYLRKREYGISELPIFRVDLAEVGTARDDGGDTGAANGARQRQEAGEIDALSPAQPQQRDYDAIRLSLYAEAMNAWRQLTDVRFRLMSLLPAISIVAFVPLLLVIQGRNPFLTLSGLVLALLGLGLTHGLHIYESRNEGLYNDLISRARRIEAELGVDTGVMLGRPAPPSPWVNHGRATQWVYRCVKLAWLTVATVLAVATVVFALDWM